MNKKIIIMQLRSALTLLAWIACGAVLYRFEYFAALGEVDNVVGALPAALAIVGAGGATAVIWMKHTKKLAPVSAVLALLIVLSVVLYPTALRGNWWINAKATDGQETQPDITVYAPFTENSLTAKLVGESTLKLEQDFPLLDGAIALYPVYAAFAEAVYKKESFRDDYALCTNTRSAYSKIISGESDIIFVAGASAQQADAAKEVGADLKFTPIGKEAFVFLNGKTNPVDNLSFSQIRNIYSGKTANWSTLGWREGGKIIAFQRPEGSGSQTGLQRIMGDLPIQSPQPLPDNSLIGTNSLLNQVSVEWQGVQPALGYSYKFFAETMYANPDAKLLKVNGFAPSNENIQNGNYPFVSNFYAVTNGEPQGSVKLLIDWILSAQGQELIEKTGYTRV